MQLKKVTTNKYIEELEKNIAFFTQSIARIEGLAKGDLETRKKLMGYLRDCVSVLDNAIGMNLGNPNHVRLMRSVSFSGERRGLIKILNLLENPDAASNMDRQQKHLLEQELKKVKALPIRD